MDQESMLPYCVPVDGLGGGPEYAHRHQQRQSVQRIESGNPAYEQAEEGPLVKMVVQCEHVPGQYEEQIDCQTEPHVKPNVNGNCIEPEVT